MHLSLYRSWMNIKTKLTKAGLVLSLSWTSGQVCFTFCSSLLFCVYKIYSILVFSYSNMSDTYGILLGYFWTYISFLFFFVFLYIFLHLLLFCFFLHFLLDLFKSFAFVPFWHIFNLFHNFRLCIFENTLKRIWKNFWRIMRKL